MPTSYGTEAFWWFFGGVVAGVAGTKLLGPPAQAMPGPAGAGQLPRYEPKPTWGPIAHPSKPMSVAMPTPMSASTARRAPTSITAWWFGSKGMTCGRWLSLTRKQQQAWLLALPEFQVVPIGGHSIRWDDFERQYFFDSAGNPLGMVRVLDWLEEQCAITGIA